ncbi:MAG: hypothetical protein VCC04_10470, partial [Myxococcota bacterium]
MRIGGVSRFAVEAGVLWRVATFLMLSPGRIRLILLKIGASLVALVISALVFEMGLRIFKHPIDYLQPVRVTDPVLFLRLLPGSGAHDEWGFRNLGVPSKVDVVAIGDSNTWGINATREKNWPGWYSQMSGKSVYNLGIPAFG